MIFRLKKQNMYTDNWNIEIRATQQRLPPFPDSWEDSLFFNIIYANLVKISNNNYINYRMIHSMISKWFYQYAKLRISKLNYQYANPYCQLPCKLFENWNCHYTNPIFELAVCQFKWFKLPVCQIGNPSVELPVCQSVLSTTIYVVSRFKLSLCQSHIWTTTITNCQSLSWTTSICYFQI